jgi:Bcr/CflA subfamily drug resistance transporter
MGINPMFLLPVFLILYGFTGGLSNDIYLPAMPTMVTYFGATDSEVQLTLTAWGLGVGMFQLFLGPWSDHYGRRPALLYGGILFLIGSLACAFAPSITALLIARFVQGMGTCSMFMITMTAIKEVFTEQNRVKWLVYYNMMRSLAPLVGPVIGAFMLIIYSWRGVFFFTAALAMFALIGLLFALPETYPGRPKEPFSVKTILREYRETLRNKYLIRHLAVGALIFGGMMVYITSGAFIMITRVGLSEQMFSYSQVAMSGAYILGAWCVQPGYRLIGARKVIAWGIASCVLGSLAMMLSFWQENLWTILIPVALYSFGFGACSTPLTERALAHEGIKTGLIAGLIGFNITLGSSSATLITSLVPVSGFYTGLIMLGFSATAMYMYRQVSRP